MKITDISNVKPGDFVKIRTYEEIQELIDKNDLYEDFWYACGGKIFKVEEIFKNGDMTINFDNAWKNRGNGRIDITYVKWHIKPMYLSDDLFQL